MDLDPDAKRLLQLTREAHTPSVADKARLDSLLGVALTLPAASASASVAPSAVGKLGASASVFNVSASVFNASASVFKWTGIALLAIAGASYLVWRVGPHEPARSATLQPAEPTAQAIAPAVSAAPAAAASETPATELGSIAPHAHDAPRSSPRAVTNASLPAELDLLHDAQSKWRAGDAEGALSLLAVHRKRFPHTQLAPERDALTVLSLCRLNRSTEAREVARRFLRTARHSPLKTSVEESCAGQ